MEKEKKLGLKPEKDKKQENKHEKLLNFKFKGI
jgi:hypothetical protein